MAPQKISVIGAYTIDLYMVARRAPDRGETLQADDYAEKVGGKGANSAIAAYRACHSRLPPTYKAIDESMEQIEIATTPSPEGESNEITVSFICAVGDDKWADMLRSEMAQSGVDISGMVTLPGEFSNLSFVMVEEIAEENRILFCPRVAKAWKPEDFLTVESLSTGHRPDLVISQMEIDPEIVEQIVETAGRANIDVVLNAAPASPIDARTFQYITHLLINESEAAVMSGRDFDEVNPSTWPKIADEFLERGVKNVVITLAERGAYYANATDRGRVPAFEVKTVDPTGAGDTFTGAYAAEYLRQKALGYWDIQKTIERSNKAAALSIGTLGAQEGIPWADAIEGFTGLFRSEVLH